MRMRGTKERRTLREEFCYKFRNEIYGLKLQDSTAAGKERIRDFIDQRARPELEYNHKTNWIDIWLTLRRDYRRVFNTEF